MTELERQFASLLKNAPGEPPITLDPDAVAFTPPRRRYFAPLVAAAAVLVLAVPVAVLLGRGSSHQPATGRPTFGPQPGQPADPRQAAIRTAETIINTAPMVPAATQRAAAPLAMLNNPNSVPGAQHVQRTRFWVASGTVAATITYLQAHPPAGMTTSGSGSARGPGVPANSSLDFQAGQFRSLNYTVVGYQGGVAVRADAQVLWAPRRSPADTVPLPVTAVDVLIVRHNPQMHQGAPTVAGTLTGTPARALTSFVNRLPRAIPTGYINCPAELGGERWFDRLVFHSAKTESTLLVNMVGCASTTLQVGDRKPIQLSSSYSAAVGDVNRRITDSVGLPANYGGR